ncbi:MAG TPA: hypothetical protein VEC10_02210 [Steroidobacteraceae bacterium]|nr:hypothetical protein [Steroidobacteraceae bacterium]
MIRGSVMQGYGKALAIGTALLTAASLVTGCATRRHDLASDSISAQAPFSRTFPGTGDAVCWSVKRAMLSQGYMLDRATDTGVLTGTRDFQPDRPAVRAQGVVPLLLVVTPRV